MLWHSEVLKHPLFFYFSLWLSVSKPSFRLCVRVYRISVLMHVPFGFFCSCYDDFDSFSNCKHNFNVHTSYIDMISYTLSVRWTSTLCTHRMRNKICEKTKLQQKLAIKCTGLCLSDLIKWSKFFLWAHFNTQTQCYIESMYGSSMSNVEEWRLKRKWKINEEIQNETAKTAVYASK